MAWKTPGQITIEELGLSPSLAPAVRTISRMAYNLSRPFTSAEASYHTVNIDDDFLKNQVYNMILPLVNEGSTYHAAVRNIRLQPIPKVPVARGKRKAEQDRGGAEGLDDNQGPRSKKSR